MFNTDREFIENKYHKTNENFNPFERMAYHGYDFDESTGLEDEEINDGLAKLYEKTRRLPHPVAKAHAVKYVLENTQIDVNEHDYFVGFWSVNRLANCVTSNKWNDEVFDNILPELKEKMRDMNDPGQLQYGRILITLFRTGIRFSVSVFRDLKSVPRNTRSCTERTTLLHRKEKHFLTEL